MADKKARDAAQKAENMKQAAQRAAERRELLKREHAQRMHLNKCAINLHCVSFRRNKPSKILERMLMDLGAFQLQQDAQDKKQRAELEETYNFFCL